MATSLNFELLIKKSNLVIKVEPFKPALRNTEFASHSLISRLVREYP